MMDGWRLVDADAARRDRSIIADIMHAAQITWCSHTRRCRARLLSALFFHGAGAHPIGAQARFFRHRHTARPRGWKSGRLSILLSSLVYAVFRPWTPLSIIHACIQTCLSLIILGAFRRCASCELLFISAAFQSCAPCELI